MRRVQRKENSICLYSWDTVPLDIEEGSHPKRVSLLSHCWPLSPTPLQGYPEAHTGKQTKMEFPHSFWLMRGPFPHFRLLLELFLPMPQTSAQFHVLGHLCSWAWKYRRERIQESYACFSGALNSGFLPQPSFYHLLFRILWKLLHSFCLRLLAALSRRTRMERTYSILTGPEFFSCSFMRWGKPMRLLEGIACSTW